MLSSQLIKQDFPVLSIVNSSSPLSYLDNAATCLIPKPVADIIHQYNQFSHANSHRGFYKLSADATEFVEKSRHKVANFINAELAESIVFTVGATEAINLVANGFVKPRLTAKHNIIVSIAEHHANFLPWQHICEESGASLRVVNIDNDGRIDMEHLETLLDEQTFIVSINHVSNVLGTTNPIKVICEKARRYNSLVLVDGAQAVAHNAIDVKNLGCDFYTFSGHKMYAGMGSGILYGRTEYLEDMSPITLGGGIVDKVTVNEVNYSPSPIRFEAGTRNTSAISGLVEAINYLERLSHESIVEHIHALARYLSEKLKELSFVEPLIPLNNQSIVSFRISGLHGHDVSTLLDQDNIAIRAGHHCAQPLHQYLGVSNSVRVSLGLYNTKEDINRLIKSLKSAHTLLAL